MDEDIISRMIGMSRARVFVWFVLGVYFYFSHQKASEAIAAYVIFTAIFFTNISKQIFLYKYKNSIEDGNFAKIIKNFVEIEISAHNAFFDVPANKSIDKVIKWTWVAVLGSLFGIISFMLFFSYLGLQKQIDLKGVIFFFVIIWGLRFLGIQNKKVRKLNIF